MELLRIIAMSMIVIYHLLYHGIDPTPYDHLINGFPIPHNALIFSGVNLFILISGYYGMKLRWKSVVKLALLLEFFRIISIAFVFAIGDRLSLYEIILQIILPYSSKNYWFISVYFMLLLTAPIINVGLKGLTLRQLRIIFGVLTFATVYSCGYGMNFGADTRYGSGFGYIQFLYLYVCGYYFHQETAFDRLNKYWFLGAFFATCIIDFILGLIEYRFLGHVLFEGFYNYPFVLFASFSLFLFFSKLNFQNKIINRIAGCALSCYLLQDGFIGFRFLYPMRRAMWVQNDLVTNIEQIALTFILIWIASYIITWIAKLWIPKATDWLCSKFRHLNAWLSELP